MSELTPRRLRDIQQGIQAVGVTTSNTSRPAPYTVLSSMTGADIQCAIMMPRPSNWTAWKRSMGLPEDYDFPAVQMWAELETLSISSARSVAAVRRLGEYHAYEYTRGGRTIGGSMIFTSFNRDVFADMYKMHPGENFDAGDGGSPPMHVDQIPPFSIVINSANEYGVLSQSLLTNVHLTNFGQTFSIHDLKTESTYTYVAQGYFPVVADPISFMEKAVIAEAKHMALSHMSVEDTIYWRQRNRPNEMAYPTDYFSLPPRAQAAVRAEMDREGIIREIGER